MLEYTITAVVLGLFGALIAMVVVTETRRTESYIGRHRCGTYDSCTPAYIAARLKYQEKINAARV